MTEKEHRENRNRLRNMRMQNARTLGEQYPDVEKIEVIAQLTFESDIEGMIDKGYKRTIFPTDYLYVYFPCLNPTCTGYGFDITDCIHDAIRNRKDIDVEHIKCDGVTDWKYLGRSGFLCDSEIAFSVHLQFSSDHGNG